MYLSNGQGCQDPTRFRVLLFEMTSCTLSLFVNFTVNLSGKQDYTLNVQVILCCVPMKGNAMIFDHYLFLNDTVNSFIYLLKL